MSRIGKSPIVIPKGVTVGINNEVISISGKLGNLSHAMIGGISVKIEDNTLYFDRSDDSRSQKAFHGLNRALVNCKVIGVTEGYKKALHIIGTGYNAELKGPWLKIVVGYSHDILMMIPDGIKIEVEAVPRTRGAKNAVQSIIRVIGIDKEEVGKFAAEIRKCRKPENYKGKGIRYSDEFVKIKAGKAGAK